ncbi:MAG: hypothetical protein ACFHHU_13485 [Porticoccaceae bacterium]
MIQTNKELVEPSEEKTSISDIDRISGAKYSDNFIPAEQLNAIGQPITLARN